jgi:enterochelin esterase-like enzyme
MHASFRPCTGLLFLAFLLIAEAAWVQPAAAQTTSPVVGSDRKVTFHFKAPNAKDVKVLGDWDNKRVAMTKDDKGVWSHTTDSLEPNLYGYTFIVDGTDIPDPANPSVRVGIREIESQLFVPGEKSDYLAIRNIPHGALHEHYYFAPALDKLRRIVVYTPPGYDATAAKTYPVLYLLHGSGDDETYWTQAGRANIILDNLLVAGKAKPMLIVMPFGHASREKNEKGKGGGTSFMEKDLLENVLPLVEKEYRVAKDANHRAIAGLSMGGNQALTIGLNHLPMFAYIGGFSAGMGKGASAEKTFASLLAEPDKSNRQIKLLWIGCGEKDGLLAANQNFSKLLTSKSIHHEWEATPNYGHVWPLWRVYLRDLLPKLFKD